MATQQCQKDEKRCLAIVGSLQLTQCKWSLFVAIFTHDFTGLCIRKSRLSNNIAHGYFVSTHPKGFIFSNECKQF